MYVQTHACALLRQHAIGMRECFSAYAFICDSMRANVSAKQSFNNGDMVTSAVTLQRHREESAIFAP